MCPALCDAMEWSLPVSSVHGLLQARILEWVAISFSRYGDGTTLTADSEEELKNLLMNVKEESKQVDLKLNIQNTKIMAFSPITSWQIHGEKLEIVTDFIFLGSKITTDGDCHPATKLKDTCSLEDKL